MNNTPTHTHETFAYAEHLREHAVSLGYIHLNGPIFDGMAFFLHREMLLALEAKPERLYLHVNSEGGSIDESMAIYDYVRAIGVPCTTVAVGLVASAACAIILQAGDVRCSYPHTRFMLHEIGRHSDRQESRSESEDMVKELNRLDDVVVRLFCDRTGIDRKHLRTLTKRKQWYLSAAEALELGIIDKIC